MNDLDNDIMTLHRLFMGIAVTGLIAGFVLLFGGCAIFDRDKGGVDVPAHLKPHIRDCMDAAIVGMRDLHGVQLKWKEKEWPLKIVAVDPIRYTKGYPVIHHPKYGGAGAYYDSARRVIVVPNRDLRRDTLVHEFGHYLLHMNGHGVHNHHERFPKFFKRYRYGGGRAL